MSVLSGKKAIKPEKRISEAMIKPVGIENTSATSVPIIGEKIAARNCII